MIAGLVSAAGAAVLALGTLTAGAAAAPPSTFTPTSDGPQSANVPYVAWVGEHVRLVACDPKIETSEAGGQLANFRLEDWSGKPEAAEIPELESGTQAFFAPSDGSPQAESGDGCVKVDYKSLAPGLSRIRGVVTNASGTIVYSHQFIVIWLTANKPTLTELPYGGDPSGNGEFVPSPLSEPESNADKGLVQVKETGSFPVEPSSLLHNVLPEASYTLPGSWPTLAGALASSSEELEPPGTNPGLWDIHGSPEEGPNSDAVGPFDSEVPETLLSNGSLNADDAPMPAIRVDVHLAPNEGGLGGVGQISGATKSQVYSDNPYYSAYIPATERPVPQASGVDGPKHGGDFPGFLNEEGPYTFWTSVHSSGERFAESTGCLQRSEGEGASYYQTPSGSLNETFYTDERGEVLVSYTPGDGFYFNHIPVFGGAAGESETGKIVKNADGGCDLKGLYKEVIGESSISATAVYPYQPVDYSSQSSEGSLVKKVRSLWEKEFFEFPKGPGENEQNVRIVVAKAQDIDGRPIVGETVCFHAQQETGLYQFSNPTNGDELEDPGDVLGKGSEVYLGGSEVRGESEGSDHLCVTTNSLGLAAIDLVNSTTSSVDLTARYEGEEIVRDHLVDFSTNIGAKEKKAAEEKAAEEKEAAEAKAAKEKEAAEAKAKAEAKEKGEKEVAAEKERVERENKAEEARVKRENEAETRQNEKEKAKEEREKATAEEILKNDEKRAAEEKAEAARREKEAAEEKARREAEVKRHEEEVAKLAKPLVTPLAGSLTGKGHGKAHVASKKKKGKKGKKSKK
ncbi:MAG TPA: hypothetical protein VG147_12080 [Solirubrobacteraceae bacterium]|jgi:hypothetical protein|nr:hypothetical protein [Solirubrobacteraceae bacterium]